MEHRCGLRPKLPVDFLAALATTVGIMKVGSSKHVARSFQVDRYRQSRSLPQSQTGTMLPAKPILVHPVPMSMTTGGVLQPHD